MPPSFKQSLEVFDEEIDDDEVLNIEDDKSDGEEAEDVTDYGTEDEREDGVGSEHGNGLEDDPEQEEMQTIKREREDDDTTQPAKRQRNHDSSSKHSSTVADQVIDALIPRLEAQLSELVNGVAIRMLEALGGRLDSLENRMEEMQQEWRDALQPDNDEARPSQTRPLQDQQSLLRESQARKKMPHLRKRVAQDSVQTSQQAPALAPVAARSNPLHSFFQEAAHVADSSASPDPESSNGNIPVPLNRRKPHAMRREKLQRAPEFKDPSDLPRFSREQIETRRELQLGPNGEKPFAANTSVSDDTPQYRLNRGVMSVVDLWKEFFVGSPDKPAINELDRRYGSAWRHKNPSECVYYGLRRTIVDELVNRVEKRGVDLEASGEQVAKVWQEIAEEMDAERMVNKASLNQYIQDLKRRDRLNSSAQPPARAYDPINGPVPPPEPVLSRTTSTVTELWKEWFEGKDDYQGHVRFPSIIALNQRWGDTWRRWKTPEYAIYLKRRCIIDIALKRILEKGEDREKAAKAVLREMDEEREREGLSLLQYNTWVRFKYNYHAAARDHVPMEFVEHGRVVSDSVTGS